MVEATMVQLAPVPKLGERTVPETMASAAAKHFAMLSAYFIVAATRIPPMPLRRTIHHTTESKPWSMS